jgi:hypothetical protein
MPARNVRTIKKELLRRHPASYDMITPLAPTLPLLGAGAQMMPRYYLFRNPLFFVYG